MSRPTRIPTQEEIKTYIRERVKDFNDNIATGKEKAFIKDCIFEWEDESECTLTLKPKNSQYKYVITSCWESSPTGQYHRFEVYSTYVY